ADDCIATRKHVDGVAGERRQRVGHGRYDADNAERSELGQCDAVFAAKSLGLEKLNAWRVFANHFHLFDLVIEPSDLSSLQLLAARSIGLVDTNAANSVDGFAAVVQAAFFKLALSGGGGGNGGIHIIEDTPRPRLAIARRGPAVAHVGEDFLNDAANELIG